MNRASAFSRVIAFFIDLTVLVLVDLLFNSFSLLGYAIGSGWSNQGGPALPSGPLSIVVGLFYFTYLTAGGAQTIGKRSVGIRVVGTNGEHVGMVRSFWRSCCYLLSAFPLFFGFFLAFVIRGRSLHDLLAGTAVVKEES
jgi:uncharacterized RDD family membrane protein YckC